jgi:hypothetical protein
MNRSIMQVMRFKQVNRDHTISVTKPELEEYARELGADPARHRPFKYHNFRLKVSLADRLRLMAARWTSKGL